MRSHRGDACRKRRRAAPPAGRDGAWSLARGRAEQGWRGAVVGDRRQAGLRFGFEVAHALFWTSSGNTRTIAPTSPLTLWMSASAITVKPFSRAVALV